MYIHSTHKFHYAYMLYSTSTSSFLFLPTIDDLRIGSGGSRDGGTSVITSGDAALDRFFIVATTFAVELLESLQGS